MSVLTGPLTVTKLDVDWRQWRLEPTLRYEIGSLGSGNIIDVLAGFITDGASVPHLLWWLLRHGAAIAARQRSIISSSVRYRTALLPNAPGRLACDRTFWEAAGVCGTPFVLQVLLYIGVRVGSWTV